MKASTLARTIVLFLALINQVLVMLGYKVIPIEDETINNLITLIFTVVTALVSWWKNNSFTKNALAADEILKQLRENSENEHNRS